MTAVHPDDTVLPGSVSNHLQAQGHVYATNNPISKVKVSRNSAKKVSANSGVSNVTPSSPLSKIQKIPGYENVTFTPEKIPPPLNPNIHQPPGERQAVKNFSKISKEYAKSAAIKYISGKICYGNNAAKEMEIDDVIISGIYDYTLETFTEKREVAWCYKPYSGLPLDTPLNGNAPLPWDIPIAPSGTFIEGRESKEVPHTACAIPCHVCEGNGKEKCSQCQGNGQIGCRWCLGKGQRFRITEEVCTYCDGSGEEECGGCNGIGQETCKTCLAKKKLKFYLQLTVIWTTHKDDFTLEDACLPVDILRYSDRQLSFEEEYPRVWPIDHFHKTSLTQASNNLITQHSRAFPFEKILRQRHSIRTLPLAKVQYSWKDEKGEYYLYGLQCKVHFPDYPQSYCDGCNVI